MVNLKPPEARQPVRSRSGDDDVIHMLSEQRAEDLLWSSKYYYVGTTNVLRSVVSAVFLQTYIRLTSH